MVLGVITSYGEWGGTQPTCVATHSNTWAPNHCKLRGIGEVHGVADDHNHLFFPLMSSSDANFAVEVVPQHLFLAGIPVANQDI